MKQVILTRGLPGSGKSTWAKKMLKDNPGQYKRVNKDDLRAMIDGGKWSKDNEKFVLYVRDNLILSALERGKHVIVDDTNLHPKHFEHISNLVKGQAIVEYKNFTDVSVEECIKRDLNRTNSVGKDVIMRMYKQFLYTPEFMPVEQDKNLPPAFIFDVDGTLADMIERGPYDWDKVHTDAVKERVATIAQVLPELGWEVIIVTGRDGSCEAATKEWLALAGIHYTEFHIRPEGNTEKDSLIKRRILEDLTTRYFIAGVFDDRDQVVKIWRESGVQCFQVDYGDF